MVAFININWSFGRPSTGAEEDEARAEQAAAAILGDKAQEAFDEYKRQWEQFDDESPMTGLALLFIEAQKAADAALTKGWHNPNGAACEIEVYSR